MKKVSIIVPIYNAEAHLHRCVSSLLAQTHTNTEIILINDGSSDSSLKICKELSLQDPRIQVLSQSNQGVSSARNRGIESATGDYLTFADADDLVYPEAISNMLREISFSEVDAVRMRCEIDKDGSRYLENTIKSKIYKGHDLDTLIGAIATGQVRAYSAVLMLRADKLPKDVRFRPELQMMEDTCFYIDLLTRLDSIKISDIVTYTYIINSKSATHNGDKFLQYAEGVLQINKRFNNLFEGRGFVHDMNAIHAKIISDYIFAVKSENKASSGFKKSIQRLHLQGYKELFKNSNLRFMPPHNVLLAYAITRGSVCTSITVKFLKFLRVIKKTVEKLRNTN